MLSKEDKALIIDVAISELDKKHREKLESQNITGNKATVYNTVAKNMVDQRNYEIERQRLVQLRENTIGISPEVAEFLNPKPPMAGKLDVIESKAEIDRSIETPGKEL